MTQLEKLSCGKIANKFACRTTTKQCRTAGRPTPCRNGRSRTTRQVMCRCDVATHAQTYRRRRKNNKEDRV